MSISVIVVDDHQLVREGLVLLLEKDPGIRIAAQADNGANAVRLCEQFQPDIVLLDLTLPDASGVDVARSLRTGCPRAKILILTMHDDRRFVAEAIAAGAAGYILKDTASAELLRAIRTIVDGKNYFSTAVANIIVTNYLETVHAPPQQQSPQLSPRETEVLRLIASGKNTKEIAMLFEISSKTVETYRANIMRKLKLFSVADLTRYAIRNGLAPLD
jgi:DNA-binding NarL/FixJ family response regulator